MMFFCVVYPYVPADAGFRMLFSRSNAANGGWSIATNAGNVQAFVFNGAGAAVTGAILGGWAGYEGERTPYILVVSCQQVAGVTTVTLYLNGRAGVTVGAAGAGFTSYAGPTTFGVQSSANAFHAKSEMLSDCGMLDTYDPTTFVSTMFGNGVAGLNAMWLADLREGRYLTWPRAAVANSDWYWAARDVVVGIGSKATWTDRYTAQAMTKFGFPQGASFPARPM